MQRDFLDHEFHAFVPRPGLQENVPRPRKITAMVLLDQEEMALVKATKPDDWQSRIGGAVISSAVIGAGVGAIEAFWTDVPAVKKEAAG